MFSNLKTYPEYKDSGEQWLGKFPAHWRQLRAKFLFREVDERSETGKEELLSVSHLTGVTPRSQKTITMFLAKSNVGHKICKPDDLVINTMWAWMGALGVTRHAGIVSPAYAVYRPITAGNILPRYADYLLRTPIYAAEYQRRSTGVNSSRLRLYPEHFLRMPVVIPRPDEQAIIVRFLDYVNGRLERAIRAKKKELALVSEMLSTVTQQTLTLQGTRTLRLSTAAEVVSRPIDRRAGQSYTPIGLYNRGRGIFHKAATFGAELGDSDFFWVEDGDLVISGQFAWEGAVALARAKDSGCVASHRYPILRGRKACATSAVLLALLRTTHGAMLLNEHSRGAAGRNRPLNIRTLLKENIPIPPVSAQVQINEVLDQEFALSQSLTQMVRLVDEYQKRLIADVVTGRVDVRGVSMPEITETELETDAQIGENESVEAESADEITTEIQ